MPLQFKDTPDRLSATLANAIDSIEGDTVTLRRLLELVGEQGLLLLCALLTIPFLLPVSIPGVSTVFGAAIILISIGIVMNRLPWFPRRLLDREIEASKLVPVLNKGLQTVHRIDRVIRPRISAFTEGAFVNRLNGLALCLGGVLLLFPLGLVPFSNTLPALGILFMAAGISQRDGIFVLLGYVMFVATIIYFSVLAWLAFSAGRGISSLFGS
ncbi:exopolysaccharide biosynthesis protein [Aquamicrobium sp. LC103]|uniref:exopolysaccharide biosynthesis protein n=1 Tax=Aquamicrobium sp. LC103 TaxID=1120658 RepID=UPI00063EAAF5|nr:exopolysaccharide biosynthesis protein [Aquamicrobium sp. LC103]TKT75061.1 exopolysaccharide biosynthesis protein [Aquamicrobium sp. LC103]